MRSLVVASSIGVQRQAGVLQRPGQPIVKLLFQPVDLTPRPVRSSDPECGKRP